LAPHAPPLAITATISTATNPLRIARMNLAFPDSDHPILARAIMTRETGETEQQARAPVNNKLARRQPRYTRSRGADSSHHYECVDVDDGICCRGIALPEDPHNCGMPA